VGRGKIKASAGYGVKVSRGGGKGRNTSKGLVGLTVMTGSVNGTGPRKRKRKKEKYPVSKGSAGRGGPPGVERDRTKTRYLKKLRGRRTN